MTEVPAQSVLTEQCFQGELKRDCIILAFNILANYLIVFVGSLQVFSAIWFWSP